MLNNQRLGFILLFAIFSTNSRVYVSSRSSSNVYALGGVGCDLVCRQLLKLVARRQNFLTNHAINLISKYSKKNALITVLNISILYHEMVGENG
jgi:hypothetical protein